MKKRMTWMIVVSMMVLFTATAFAGPTTAEEAVEYRQAVMEVIGVHFTSMGAMMKGSVPYVKEAFETDSNVVATLIPLPWEAFLVVGSDKGSGLKPDALSQKEKFLEIAKACQTEVDKLATAAKSGDMGTIKPQFGATGGSCKACHDAYRSK